MTYVGSKRNNLLDAGTAYPSRTHWVHSRLVLWDPCCLLF